MRLRVLGAVAAASLTLATSAYANAPVLHAIHHWAHVTHHYQRLMHKPLTPYHWRAERTTSIGFRLWIRKLWHDRARHAHKRYLAWHRRQLRPVLTLPSSWVNGAMCVHHYEGAWNAVSHTVPTYFGGMQMDMAFMRAYGPEFLARWGTADHWPAWAQLVASYRGYLARGWSPWPLTARRCGLL